ncbi:hypothetical protein [Actinoplanes sp. HUAS TT8]|uniref:hypothetical protein n=1 Tax=Actinoplanes sp. HUAS TT8 TaxID=3447453 RepID=UPI003F523D97
MTTKRGRAAAARVTAVGWCPDHAKRLYSSRKEARRAGRTYAPGGHPNAYPCDTRDGWHWGHLGAAVAAGAMSRMARYAEVTT